MSVYKTIPAANIIISILEEKYDAIRLRGVNSCEVRSGEAVLLDKLCFLPLLGVIVIFSDVVLEVLIEDRLDPRLPLYRSTSEKSREEA